MGTVEWLMAATMMSEPVDRGEAPIGEVDERTIGLMMTGVPREEAGLALAEVER